MSDANRLQAAEATVARREAAKPAAPAPAPAPARMGKPRSFVLLAGSYHIHALSAESLVWPESVVTHPSRCAAISEADMEARRQHLLEQRQKIMEKNTAKRAAALEDAAAERKSAPPPPAPTPEPAAAAEPSRPSGVVHVQPKQGNAAQQRLTQALAAQMRRDLLSGMK